MNFPRLITENPCQDVSKNDVNMLQAAWQLEKNVSDNKICLMPMASKLIEQPGNVCV